jgi:DNA polymerase-1
MIEYRDEYGFWTKFCKPYLRLHINEILHSDYNQSVRTGRMSCRNPNAQQLYERAKRLIKPRPGNAFATFDYSQIEFRIIVHYIKDKKAISAYKDNPWTDFHTWVAEICGIPRKAGKTLNFLMGYGGGKNRAMVSLAGVEDFVEKVRNRIEQMLAEGTISANSVDTVFNNLIRRVAEDTYYTYHDRLPTLKQTARNAEYACKGNKAVQNLYGRWRDLPPQFAHVAFNAACQSSAADLIKERLVAIWRALQGSKIKIVAAVHDSITVEGPIDQIRDERTINDIVWMMEHPTILDKLRVPIKVNYGISEKDWADSDGKGMLDAVEPSEPFAHLKEKVYA